MPTDVLVEVKECDVCKAALRIIRDDERETAYEIASGEEHDCFEIPDDAELLVMKDEGCNCE